MRSYCLLDSNLPPSILVQAPDVSSPCATPQSTGSDLSPLVLVLAPDALDPQYDLVPLGFDLLSLASVIRPDAPAPPLYDPVAFLGFDLLLLAPAPDAPVSMVFFF